MDALEALRSLAVIHCGSGKSFAADWTNRRTLLRGTLPSNASAVDVVNLGDHLRDTFRTTMSTGRGQAELSSGGAVWSHLVCLYLNMCLAETDAIAVTKSFTPQCIKDCLNVSHSSGSVSSDLDVVLFYLKGLGSLQTKKSNTALKDINAALSGSLANATVVVVQTKTNWNDSVQVPMLWNLLYELGHIGKMPRSMGLTMGKGVFTISQIKDFLYAFVTVPTQDLSEFAPQRATILRALTMTGGYYWGAPSIKGVCTNVKELLPQTYSKTMHNFVAPHQLGVAFAKALKGATVGFDFRAFAF